MKTTDRNKPPFRVGVLSVVKHDYLPRAIATHPRFELVCVADDADRHDWTHDRNQRFADQCGERVTIAADGKMTREPIADAFRPDDVKKEDWNEVVEHPDVNYVVVGTPDALHHEAVMAAAAASKLVSANALSPA